MYTLLVLFLMLYTNLYLERMSMLNWLLLFEMMNLILLFYMFMSMSDLNYLSMFPMFLILLCESILGLIILMMNYRVHSESTMELNSFLLWE